MASSLTCVDILWISRTRPTTFLWTLSQSQPGLAREWVRDIYIYDGYPQREDEILILNTTTYVT
jgi:hypothetical protein